MEGTLPPAERPRQGKYPGFFRILREEGAIQGNPVPRARLEKGSSQFAEGLFRQTSLLQDFAGGPGGECTGVIAT